MLNQPDESAGNSPGDQAEPMDRERRLAFLNLDRRDAEQLRSAKSTFDPHAGEFVDRFYRHLADFAETARFLKEPETVERLKKMQQAHLDSLLVAEWDEEYVRSRWRVGHAHADAGVEPVFFLGGYSLYVQHFFDVINKQGQAGSDQRDCILALMKAIFLDVGLTLDAYFSQSTRNLKHALDMLWKANEELRRFAQLTTHDLKTPLATVANLCDEVLDEFGDQIPREAGELLSGAREATFRMSTMIDELLAAALSARSTDAESTVSSGAALHEAIDRVRPMLKKKNIRLIAPDSLPEVWGNHARLREAFFNLLSNAAKFVEPGAGLVEVTVDVRDDTCVFAVSDNGPGIPPEHRDRIFVPFRRLPAHHDQPGSGLGLYFTRTLIEQQGGSVWVESQPGHGSRFFVLLRRHGPREAADS